MTTTNHTPGPWAITKGAYGALWAGPAMLPHPGRDMEFCAQARGASYLAERDADARLIAAAPDLLAALRDLFAGMEQHGAEKWMPHRMERARAVIASATGGAA